MSVHVQAFNGISELVADHRRLEAAFQQFETMTIGSGQHALIAIIVAELQRHSDNEQRCLYPTVSRLVPGGEKLAAEHLEDHDISARVMQELQLEDPDSVGFERAARMLMATTRRHMRQEEEELFPLLQEARTDEQLYGDIEHDRQRAMRSGCAYPPQRTWWRSV